MITLTTKHLLLRTITMRDTAEVARMWNFEKGSISRSKARKAIRQMWRNQRRNRQTKLVHLCLAVFERDALGIIGWCGLDGKRAPDAPDLFYLIGAEHRGKGYATECARRLIAYALEDAGLPCVRGGCARENAASGRVMEKAGMIPCGFEPNGDPLFEIRRPSGH